MNLLRNEFLAAGILAASLVLAGCNSAAPGGAAGGPPGGSRPPAEVGVVTLKTEPVTLTTELPGRTSPYRIADVRREFPSIATLDGVVDPILGALWRARTA